MNLKRRLPNSNITRQNALNAAVVQLAIEPGTLTAATQTRLTTMNSNYNNAQTAATDATGCYQIETKITGEVTLRVHGPDDASGRQTVTIPEHEGPITINVPDILW